MSIGQTLQAWRLARKQSSPTLAARAGLEPAYLASIETGEIDPPVSALEALASALSIPVSWLHGHPAHLARLLSEEDGVSVSAESGAVDPVLEQVLQGARHFRELYVLLTAVLQSEDPKLVRAAQASLQSLARQAKQSTVPWESRPPGHFEPPSD